MKVLIRVTQDDIKQGTKGSCTGCPIALAIGRILNPNYYVTVGRSSIMLYAVIRFFCEWRMEPPKEVSDFIVAFDKRQVVEPFEFEVDIPEEYLKRTL